MTCRLMWMDKLSSMINQRSAGKAQHDFLQQLNVTGTIPSGTEQRNGLSGSRLKPAMHPQLPAPSIIWFKGRPVWTQLPFFSRIGLDRNRSHFIHTDHPGAGKRGQVGRYDAPLFSTNSGSCFSASWNQLCWRFHLNPSPSTHSQMVESDKWTPSRSWKAVCKRSNVHNLNGYPSVSGFWVARLIKALRTFWSWVGGAQVWVCLPNLPCPFH